MSNLDSLVSVIVPSYNHEKFILDCLQSIYEQSYVRIELVIVDDSSKDDTFSRAKALVSTNFGRRFENIIAVCNDSNLGANETINKGIRLSSGEYVTVINSDDMYAPCRVNKMLSKIMHDETELCFSMVDVMIDESYHQVVPEYLRLLPLQQAVDLGRDLTVGFSLLRKNLAISTGNMFFTRNLYEKIGGFSSLKYCHDWDFILQSLYYCEPSFVREPLYHYRLHGNNSFSDLGQLAGLETEVVIRSFIRRGLAKKSINRLFPSNNNWPGYFELFLAELGFKKFFDLEYGRGLEGWRIYTREK